MARLLISSGEPSGELYAAELLRCLLTRCPTISAVGLGGDRLRSEGATLVAHIRELAVVGLLEVVSHLPRIRAIFRKLLAEVDRERPDLAVLIDYPDFNLRLARELHRRGIPVVYYVSPQVWAWRGGRIRTIRELVDRMIVIFPFEESLYQQAGVPVSFVGHPLVDVVRPAADPAAFLREAGLEPARPVIALLPGSRRNEVALNIAPLVEAVRSLAQRQPELQFLLALAPALAREPLDSELSGLPVRIVRGQTHAALSVAKLALVASGTATVEAALLGTPMIVVYRVSALSYLLGRPFVRVPHYAMANLIAERRIVPELIQNGFTGENVAREAEALLGDAARLDRMREDLGEVRRRLGGPGASERAATVIVERLQHRSESARAFADSP